MVSIIVHGGAGTIKDDQRRRIAAEGTDLAAAIGYKILEQGGSSLEAVKQAVQTMEDLPQFNAGYGSVITEEKTIEMDALLCDGYAGNLGGVMGISRIKNPILLCETIMNESKHLLFAGVGAEKFAQRHGYQLIDSEDLITDRVRERFTRWQESQQSDRIDPEGRDKYGTVGAVALDADGKLAAATSTGGTLGKQVGRIGDAPIFGAGTYADREIAVSATGVGEYIIQSMIGLRIKTMAATQQLREATKLALDEANQRYGPMGVIVIDSLGNWVELKTTRDLVYSYFTSEGSGNFLGVKSLETGL